MKRILIYRIVPVVAIIGIVTVTVVFSLSKPGKKIAIRINGKDTVIQSNIDDPYINSKRENITFILGEDKPGSNPYYSLAFDYYKSNKAAHTENIVTTCRSLTEVRDYLRDNPPANDRPWGLINLVSHGNEWFGMSVPVAPGSKRSSTERIAEYVNTGKFEPLPNALVDDSTEIYLHGCGLGKDHDLLKIIGKAFGGKGHQPIVRASKLKEYYASLHNAGKVLNSQLFFAKTWNVYYKYKDKPDDSILLQEFRKLYPKDSADWNAALNRSSSVITGDVFHYNINVPVYFTAMYSSPDSLPDLSTDEKKLKWISHQKTLINIIAKTTIPLDKFKWSTQKIFIKDANNVKKPAIDVSGMCTVLCVVKPLIKERNTSTCDATPFFPSINDTVYFGRN